MATLIVWLEVPGGQPLAASLTAVITTSDGVALDAATERVLGGAKTLRDGDMWEPPDLTADTITPTGALYRISSSAAGPLRGRQWWWDGAQDKTLRQLATSPTGTPTGPLIEAYDDAEVRGLIDDEADARANGDAATLAAAKTYTDGRPTPPDASTTAKGLVRLATAAQTVAGTATDSATSPAGVKAATDDLQSRLLGGASSAWDTLQELKGLVDSGDAADQAAIANLVTLLGQKIPAVDRESAGGVAGLTTAGKLYEARIPDRLTDASLDKRYARGNSIGTKLRQHAALAKAHNSIDLGPMATPPTVTASNTADGTLGLYLRTYIGGGPAFNSFSFRGGALDVLASLAYRCVGVTVTSGGNISTTKASTGWAVEFYSDAPKLQLAIVGSTSETVFGYQIEVDDQPIAATSRVYEFTNAFFVTLDFSGVRKIRKFRYEVGSVGTGAFDGVRVTAADSVWAAPASVRAVVVGDSLSSQTGANTPNGGWPKVLGKLLGWSDVRSVAIGGCGFVTVTGSGNVIGSASRVADAAAANPDVLFISGSQNDETVTPSTLTAAALAAFQAYRTALPDVPIICGGLHPGSTGPSANMQAAEDAVKAAFDTWADPKSWWIPVTRATDTNNGKGWVYGTGRVGATNGSGNTDVLIGAADTAHPSPLGHLQLARRYDQAIRSKVLTSAALT